MVSWEISEIQFFLQTDERAILMFVFNICNQAELLLGNNSGSCKQSKPVFYLSAQ